MAELSNWTAAQTESTYHCHELPPVPCHVRLIFGVPNPLVTVMPAEETLTPSPKLAATMSLFATPFGRLSKSRIVSAWARYPRNMPTAASAARWSFAILLIFIGVNGLSIDTQVWGNN